MFRRPHPLVLLIALAWPLAARAIDPERGLGACNVEVWRARDGLPGAWIRGFTQTADGYLWIGTQRGLVRYGGGELVNLAPPRSLERAGDVMGLAVAADGTVWVTPSRGEPVCVRGDVFSACVAGPATTRVTELEARPDGIWFAASEGIHRFADAKLALVHPAAEWGGATVTALHRDGDELWVGTGKGLFHARGAGPLEPQPIDGATPAIVAIARAASGGVWVLAAGRLARIDGARTAVFGARDGMPEARLTSLLEDRDGNVWVGTRDGLLRFQPGRGFARFTRNDGLPEDDVTALFEDREGSLWVGTRAGGLGQFTDRTLDRQSGPASLAAHWVSTVAEDDEGTLWAGSGQGLTRYRGGEERTFTNSDGLPSIDVLSIYPTSDGLWVGTKRGLCFFRDERARPIAEVTGTVSALALDGDDLWIGSSDGVARWRAGKIERFAPAPEVADVPLGEIRGIARDDRDIVWVSANGKLLRIEGGQLRRDPTVTALGLSRTRSLWRDGDGTLWLGTGDGLVRRKGGAWHIYGPRQGLERSDLYQVVGDDLGFLWIGTGYGLLRVAKGALDDVDAGRRTTVDPVSFQAADQNREVRVTRTRQPGVWKNRAGWLRFATSRGVVTVDPRRVPGRSVPPPVIIERALVDGRAARRGVVNQFPPGSGAFEFHFAAITLIEPRKAQHRYLLEGYDRHWVEAGARRWAYYTNMKPGRYRFRVQGSNADGIWNETGDALELVLAPHVYQTWWFFALVALATVGLVLSFHRLRLERVRGHYLATLAERTRVAREVHDSILQGMTATLMHLRGLRKRFTPGAPPAAATTVAGEIKEIEDVVAANIEETRQFVWDLRDGKRPAQQLAPALEELAARLGSRSSVDVQVTVSGTPVPLPRDVQHELMRIAHEALTNGLKHARARQIEVRLEYQDHELRLTVHDDGRGFDPQAVAGVERGHFGLAGMSERARMLGRFDLESRPGEGTTVEVIVNLEDLRDA